MQTTSLMPNGIGLWQPAIGDKVRIVRVETKNDLIYLGKLGQVVKNKGFGTFLVQLEDGVTVRFPSKCLCKKTDTGAVSTE